VVVESVDCESGVHMFEENDEESVSEKHDNMPRESGEAFVV